jgi:hypothetical protein
MRWWNDTTSLWDDIDDSLWMDIQYTQTSCIIRINDLFVLSSHALNLQCGCKSYHKIPPHMPSSNMDNASKFVRRTLCPDNANDSRGRSRNANPKTSDPLIHEIEEGVSDAGPALERSPSLCSMRTIVVTYASFLNNRVSFIQSAIVFHRQPNTFPKVSIPRGH